MTNNKQQTAVEWFIEQLNSKYGGNDFLITHINEIEKAKEIDKKRIAKAFTDGKGQNFSFYDKTGEQYYNETYGGGEQ
jgi:hypothetical protein